ncbi:UDP-glycosyltransferase [Algibacter sp. L1A34]|uniref:UDP-glycosyltransferase n=1 Tax=Algibacter sp. L1A34 TaxID=2686365 RepID=UPI00131EBD3A|nr:UDP-glycosyltransferase [Algibacter sp. L1A34]
MSIIKKVLVIVESIDVNATSGAKVNMALINALLLCKYEVTVLHYTREIINIPLANCIAIKENKTSLKYFLSRAQRVFQRITKINISKNLENIFGHSFTFFNDSKSIAYATIKYYNNHDLIITLSQGASFRPHHAMLKHSQLHSKWVAYVHDPYPFHLYPEPYDWIEAGYKQKEDFFRKVSEHAKYSAFPSQLLKEWVGQFFPKFLETGFVIPHQHLISPQQIKLENLPYFNSDNFTLLHAGNLMKQRSPEGLIKGFKLFLKTNPKAKKNSMLMLIGPSSYYESFLETTKNKVPQLYINNKRVAYNEIQFLQERVDVNIILEAKTDISPFLPGKFPHCVFANKPILVLGPNKSETKRLLGQDYLFQAEANEFNKISKLIEKLYFNWLNKKEIELNRPDLEKYLNPSRVGVILEKYINKV